MPFDSTLRASGRHGDTETTSRSVLVKMLEAVFIVYITQCEKRQSLNFRNQADLSRANELSLNDAI